MTEEKPDIGWWPEEKVGSKNVCLLFLNDWEKGRGGGRSGEIKGKTMERGMSGWKRMLKGDKQQEHNFGRTSKCHLASPLFFQEKETKFLI